MNYYTDNELEAGADAVLDNIMNNLAVSGLEGMAIRNLFKGFITRQVANALTAAAKARGQK